MDISIGKSRKFVFFYKNIYDNFHRVCKKMKKEGKDIQIINENCLRPVENLLDISMGKSENLINFLSTSFNR